MQVAPFDLQGLRAHTAGAQGIEEATNKARDNNENEPQRGPGKEQMKTLDENLNALRPGRRRKIEERAAQLISDDLCFWQVGLAHFGGLIWPTPGTLKVKRTAFRSAGA